MDISIIGKESIKIKGKKATFVVDPTREIQKTSSDAVIFLNGEKDCSKVADYRMIINGPGEYEVSSVKIAGTRTPNGILYRLSMDGITLVLGYPADAKSEGFNECQVAIINANIDMGESSFITTLEPKISVMYGEKKVEAAKILGAEITTSVPKVTVMKDKLPEKMEVVVLE